MSTYAYAFCGALAQLGERFAGSEQVSGSIPLGSTNKLLYYPFI